MPGRVIKLLVAPGAEVAEGQSLLILEAMKMQNEIRAPRAGVVAALPAAEGAAVESGQPLVIFE
jgi:biotin carboxyl carrier protein